MHNGSVPNLYEMLIPAAERNEEFYLGGDSSRQGRARQHTPSGTFLMVQRYWEFERGHSFQDGPRGDGVIAVADGRPALALVEYLNPSGRAGPVTIRGPPAN